MKQGTAVLIKHKTANGMWIVRETIPLRKLFVVDLDSVGPSKWFNMEKNEHHDCECILCQNDDGTWALMPTELLKIKKTKPKVPK